MNQPKTEKKTIQPGAKDLVAENKKLRAQISQLEDDLENCEDLEKENNDLEKRITQQTRYSHYLLGAVDALMCVLPATSSPDAASALKTTLQELRRKDDVIDQ